MPENEEHKERPAGEWEDRYRHYWRGKRVWGIILGVVILVIVFSIGVKVGEFRAYFGPGYGNGYWGMPMMRWGGYGPNMMAPGWWYYGPSITTSTTTTVPNR